MNRGPRRDPVSITVQLLGRPQISDSAGKVQRLRSRKSWAVLAYLLLTDRPPTRSQLASLLFPEADDPARALRWSLTEIRRALGPGATIDGDPVVLHLPEDAEVDAKVLVAGAWIDSVRLPGLGADLLDGSTIHAAAAFETWLLSEQRHLGAVSEAVLHEAALGSMSVGELDSALGFAVRLVTLNPLDENNQAALIRMYRLVGDDEAAARQLAACAVLFQRELGVLPGAAVQTAARATRYERYSASDAPAITALIEAGSAAISAGAFDAGVASLATATRLADTSGVVPLRVAARLAAAEAYIHGLGGLDEEGLARLYEANEIASSHGLTHAAANARAELGYVDFLRARYDRAERWLADAMANAGSSVSVAAKASTYLGSVESDRANYHQATSLLVDAVALSKAAQEPRRQAFALSMLGRMDLLRGDLDSAGRHLDRSIQLAEADHWLSFLPWPQALAGHVHLAAGNVPLAAHVLDQAFARACQIGDPCWEGTAARGLALVAEARGDVDLAFSTLSDARTRANRLADPYVWLDGYILDAQCDIGRRHGHRNTNVWVESMRLLASRCGMRELTVRALIHSGALGNAGDAQAAALLASDIDSEPVAALIA